MVNKTFSRSWKKSVQPRKQRKYKYNLPLPLQQKFILVNLSPSLREKYGRRNFQARKGDKVKVLRGQYKKKEGKVERVDLKRQRIFVSGLEYFKKDGTKIPVPFHPTNLMILELDLNDKKRKEKIETKQTSSSSTSKKKETKRDIK